MSGDKCRWFNKNGFAFGTGECVLHRRVCGSGHKVCEQYEEYESRPHGEWIDRSDGGRIRYPFWERYECSKCGAKSENTNFCPNCGADMSANDRQVTGKLNSEIEKSKSEIEKSKSEKTCLNCGTSECELGNRARYGFCGNWTERR